MENRWFLGKVQSSPDGEKPGKVKVLASLKQNPDGDYVVNQLMQGGMQEEFGPSGSIFWPQSPKSSIPSGVFVRFQCERTDSHGDSSSHPPRDWWKIMKVSENWLCDRMGYRVVERQSLSSTDFENLTVQNCLEGDQIYLYIRSESKYIGLFQVGETADKSNHRNIKPIDFKNVRSFKKDVIPKDCHYPSHASVAPGVTVTRYFLYAPDDSLGTSFDWYTQKQYADWCIERLKENMPNEVFREIAKLWPKWEDILTDGLKQLSSDERILYQARWERLIKDFSYFQLESNSISQLIASEPFRKRIKEFIDLDERQQTPIIPPEEDDKLVSELEKQVEELQHQLREERQSKAEEISEFDAELDRCADEILRLKSELQSAQEAYSIPPVETIPQKIIEPVTEVFSDSEFTVQRDFVEKRLWPILYQKYPNGVSKTLAKFLHAAVLGSKAILVPNPVWAKGYSEAIGPKAVFRTIHVEPLWIRFQDLWEGGLKSVWQDAHRNSDKLYFVLLRDFNRALPQYYARPLLDLIARYSDVLEVADSTVWPENLRLFACPSNENESLPLTAEVLHHFSGIDREVRPCVDSVEYLKQGYVSAETWFGWLKEATEKVAKDSSDTRGLVESEPISKAIGIDCERIKQVLIALRDRERDAVGFAKDIRLEIPKDNYLPKSEEDT